MKINAINIGQLFVPKVCSRNNSFPVFKSQELTSDVFVKTTTPIEKPSETEERRNAIPPYLYHLTNADCYEKIMETGQINLSKDMIDGVFMFDMDDFQKNWRNTPNSTNRGSLAQSLVEQALKKEKGLVMLRIPTEKLDPMKFAIRPEDDVTKYIKSTEFACLTTMFERKGGILNHKEMLPKDMVEGYSPVKAQEYFDESRPVEYIYQGNISLLDVPVENVFEIPDMDRKTVWGYGIKHFDELFNTLGENA